MFPKAISGLLVVWCTLAFAAESEKVLREWDHRTHSSRGPATWRPGNPQLERLSTCLDDVRSRVPPGSVIAFASPKGQTPGGHNDFFRTRWAAFLLPGYEVLPIDDPSAGRMAEYVIDYRSGLRLPRLELVARLQGCRLLKVRQPPSP